MASLFAGIPLEGSGARPLEADLYAAEGQLSDVENLAGTGNLNIGYVIQYDEQVQRHMSGGNLTEEGPAALPQLSRGLNSFLPEAGDRNTPIAGDNANTMQNTTISRPDVQSMNAPRTNIAEQESAQQTADELSVTAPPSPTPTSPPPGGSTAVNSSSNTEIINSYNTTTYNTTYNYYNSSHGVLNIYNNGSLIDIDNVLNNNTLNLNNLINLGDVNVINISDIEINNVLNNLLGGGGGDCCITGLLTEVVGGVTNIVGGVTTVVGGTVNVLGDVLSSTTLLAGSITNVLGNTLNNAVNMVGGTINNVVDSGISNTLHIVTNVLTPVNDVVDDVLGGGLLGGQPLLDINANILTNAFPAANDDALINADVSLLGLTHDAPDAAGLGLVDVEASLLSMPQEDANTDGLSLTINTDVLGIDLLQSLPVVDIDVPLPTAEEVSPLLPPLIEDVLVNADNLDAQLDNIVDPIVTFAALTDSSNLATAIDVGILFAGADAGSGATAPVIAAPDVHLGDVLVGGLFHH